MIVASVMAGYTGHRGWLNYLAVAPEQRHRGLGKEIVAAAEKLLLEIGCPKINIQVRGSNAVARGFYESQTIKLISTDQLADVLPPAPGADRLYARVSLLIPASIAVAKEPRDCDTT